LYLQIKITNQNQNRIKQSYNKVSISYVPNIGYFKKGETTPFEPIQIIKNTNIEVFKYSVNLLQNIFKDVVNNLINQDEIFIDKILFDENIGFLANAFGFIRENSFTHFQLIEQCCKKCLLFKTNPKNTNSFATINAHGIAFINVYQNEYDEVFFVDDIAHQTGHIILTTLFFNRNAIFKIDESQQIEEILKKKDHRDIYILFHALYTYYTTLMCLDDCLTNNVFNEKQKNEAIGRIGFYLKKCTYDLYNLEIIEKYFLIVRFLS
jgi:sialic acid synthase SpsE